MDAQWMWWIAAAVLIGAELMTGTFYLLAIGVALAIGGVAAMVQMSIEAQFLIAAVAGIVLVFVAHRWRHKHGRPPPPVPHDVGQTVHVATWNADGTARVDYRGTQWTAELAHADSPRHQTMVIVGMRGPNLIVDAPKH
ncbi:MAG: NfeD family protein [Proteobacteria bacterium]|nr:NfeD family protein [Pseudomonadota bacterium]